MAIFSKLMFSNPNTNRSFVEGTNASGGGWQRLYAFSGGPSDQWYAYITGGGTFDAGCHSQVAIMGGFSFSSGTYGTYGTGDMGTNRGRNVLGTSYDVSIVGIEVILWGNTPGSTSGTAGDSIVQLTVDGTTGYGSNLATVGTYNYGLGTAASYIYGGSRCLWGTRFTREQICNGSFGVRYAAKAINNDAGMNVAAIGVRVYFDTVEKHYEPVMRSMRREPCTMDDRITNNIFPWSREYVPPMTSGSRSTASGSWGTLWASGTGITAGGTAATFYNVGTVVLALGSGGTVKMTGGAGGSTFGTAREIYFCETRGTSPYLTTGPTRFTHYYVHTRGYSATSFTYGTNVVGTGGTQINHSGTASTHMLWVKWKPT